jgi:hypothetical protein
VSELRDRVQAAVELAREYDVGAVRLKLEDAEQIAALLSEQPAPGIIAPLSETPKIDNAAPEGRERERIERVEYDDAGELDEVVGRGPFHLEMLDDDAVYLGLGDAQLWICAVTDERNNARIQIRHEGLSSAPPPAQPSEEA